MYNELKQHKHNLSKCYNKRGPSSSGKNSSLTLRGICIFLHQCINLSSMYFSMLSMFNLHVDSPYVSFNLFFFFFKECKNHCYYCLRAFNKSLLPRNILAKIYAACWGEVIGLFWIKGKIILQIFYIYFVPVPNNHIAIRAVIYTNFTTWFDFDSIKFQFQFNFDISESTLLKYSRLKLTTDL